MGEPIVGRVPDELLRLMLPQPKPSPARPVRLPGRRRSAVLTGLVRFVLEAPDGELNNRLYWAACRAFETDVDADAVAAALVEAAVTVGHPEAAAARTVASARNAPARKRR
ncbi:hypothetical protein GCM10010420_07400 [Streptomyces glaucosporus]|uniref:Primase C-terminal 1 domain-containing protein n=1 Tax=Streptomyces glaucosporus TaxID=284044 RepID=A0ABP5UU82_9ACTN